MGEYMGTALKKPIIEISSKPHQFPLTFCNMSSDIPQGDTQDNDYVSRTGQEEAPIPVQSDNDVVESGVDAETADSDEQLARDDNEAIDESNIIDEKTRGWNEQQLGHFLCSIGAMTGISGSEDGTIRWWKDGEQEQCVPCDNGNEIRSLRYLPGKKSLLVKSSAPETV